MIVTCSEGRRPAWPPAPRWALVLFALLLVAVALGATDLPGWVVAVALLAPVAALALLAVFPPGSLVVCAGASQLAALAMDDSVPPWSVALAAAVGLVSVLAGRVVVRPAIPLVVFAVGAVVGGGVAALVGREWGVGPPVLLVAVVLPWSVGRSIRQQTEVARLRERNRIAHDMHDTLGHELSLLALRAGALEMTADLAEPHRRAVAELRSGAAAATDRLAEIIGVLRDGEPAPLRPADGSVDELVERAAAAGLAVTLETDGETAPPVVERTVVRIVQEALTNAMKHAPGAIVRVRRVTAQGRTVVTVTNTVAGGGPGAGSRRGLAGLREGVRAVGGTLRAGRRGDVFEIVATLPHGGER
ncbi:hypothetical protein SUDANB95_02618 [Actinosynnema sp. ALI-1.44]